MEKLLTHEKEKFKKYKYILVDHTLLTSLNITKETVEYISGLLSGASSDYPDTIVAMVAYVSYGANIDLIEKISQMRKLFMNRSCWETLQFKNRPYVVRWIKDKVKNKFGIDNLNFS